MCSMTIALCLKTFRVQKSGIYYIVMVQCKTTDKVTMEGSIVWQNPFGHLPAEMFAYLPVLDIPSIMKHHCSSTYHILNFSTF